MLQQKWKKTLKLGLYVKCFTTQPVFKIHSHPALWITSDVFYIHKFAKNHNASCAIERNQGDPKTYLQSVFPSGSVQAHRYSFQRCRNLKRKKMTGTNSAGEAKKKNLRGVWFVATAPAHQKGECRCLKAGSREQVESRRLCSSVSLCCFPHRVFVYVLCDPAISVPWETWRSILTPHLPWPLSHPYRSPSPPHWCIFISIVTWLFKGSLA